MTEKKLIGEITHYFSNISVAVVKLSGTLKEGDTILIEGATTNFEQEATSMQVEHNRVEEANAGQSVGLKVTEKVREGDKVYKIVGE
ncbi:MAG: translation elongation factor-like protein [Candidatus Aenigmatarchaeota archaeon]|nr:MAG: translation elongation factor-like protein [Candidatus Aenigmarchaeota archaeon]